MYRNLQSGFGYIAAIVILVILSVLAAFIVILSATEAIDESLDVQASKAFSVATAGIEWGMYQAVKSTSCVASTDLGLINGSYVTVTCTQVATSTNEPDIQGIYRIVATACNMPSGTTCPGTVSNPNYVERRIESFVGN
jgi:MSHA biogenesis protein MshP